MQHGSNVEILGFTASTAAISAPRPVAADVASGYDRIAEMIEAANAKTASTLQADLQKLVVQVSEGAVRRALEASNTTVLGTFKAISTILATRLILFSALIGAFILAWTAMENPSWPCIVILISYVLLTVLPLVWLDRNGRRSPNE